MKRTSRKLSKEQKESLLKSPYVEKAGNSIVNYTDEFKRMAVDQYQKGKSPVEIFTEAQIDVRIIGSKNAFNLVKKWIKEQDKRLNKSQNTKLSIEQQLKEAQARIKYLEEELDFRKKLQALEEK